MTKINFRKRAIFQFSYGLIHESKKAINSDVTEKCITLRFVR